MKGFDCCDTCTNCDQFGCILKGVKIAKNGYCLSYREKGHGKRKGQDIRHPRNSEC